MKKSFSCLALSILLSSCSSYNHGVYVAPDYNHIVAHAVVVEQNSNYVVYEYSDIRVDEIAPVAAIYCHDHGGRKSSLYDINLRPDHKRRATFVCQ